MLSKTLAAVGLLGLMASPAMAANFMQVAAPPYYPLGEAETIALYGIVILNLQNSALTGCPAAFDSNFAPLGQCSEIGVMDVTGVNGSPANIQVSISTGSWVNITNVITGFTAICTVATNWNPPVTCAGTPDGGGIECTPPYPTDATFGGSCIGVRAF